MATICYTSGTTGTPKVSISYQIILSLFQVSKVESFLNLFVFVHGKGAVLSHGNMIANLAGGSLEIKFYPSDV